MDWYPSFTDDEMGMESLDMAPAGQRPNTAPWFNPVNITIENGVYYVTIYVCHTTDGSPLAQKLSIWLQSLKDTDHIRLSVSSLISGIPTEMMMQVLAGLVNTKAHVEILLDQIVLGELAYFYLAAKSIRSFDCGDLFIPSYRSERQVDTSAPQRAILDFYEWIVEQAVAKGRLTEEEALLLNEGHHVIVPGSRYI